jgi:hypothetical protein
VRHTLGALPPVRPQVFADWSAYVNGKLPVPPTSVAVPAVVTWGMDGNNQYGDCTIAGADHCIAAWDLEVKEADPVATDAADVLQYKAITGCVTPGDSRDTGLVLSDVLKLWSTKGLFGGNEIAGYAPVRHQAILDMHQAIAAYGAAYVGVALPQSAEDQFGAGPPWTLVGDQPVGGHCVAFVGYDPEWMYAVTWGGVVKVSWAWWAYYGQEAWAIIPQAFVEAGKGPDLNLAQLKADIGTLTVPKAKKAWWKI